MRRVLATAFALVGLLVPSAAYAQEVTVSSPYPAISVEAGKTASFDLSFHSSTPVRLDLDLRGLPEDWDATFRGGGRVIGSVTAGTDGRTVDLDVKVPATAADGDYDFAVIAAGGEIPVEVPLTITVLANVGGEVVITPRFPGLRGDAGANFDFDVTIENGTLAAVDLELEAGGPPGWRVEARPSGESQASTISIEPGSTGRVTVEADPPIGAAAGTYEITFRAKGEDVDEEIPLVVQIIGNYALELNTTDQRLNAEVTAGQPTEVPVVVLNTGTASLVNVELSATQPRNWEITLEPEAIPEIAPGEMVTATATITPSTDAIAGDYRVTLRAQTDQVQDSIELRTTVSPSAVWGLVGVGIIALTLGGLALVFRRFGRR